MPVQLAVGDAEEVAAAHVVGVIPCVQLRFAAAGLRRNPQLCAAGLHGRVQLVLAQRAQPQRKTDLRKLLRSGLHQRRGGILLRNRAQILHGSAFRRGGEALRGLIPGIARALEVIHGGVQRSLVARVVAHRIVIDRRARRIAGVTERVTLVLRIRRGPAAVQHRIFDHEGRVAQLPGHHLLTLGREHRHQRPAQRHRGGRARVVADLHQLHVHAQVGVFRRVHQQRVRAGSAEALVAVGGIDGLDGGRVQLRHVQRSLALQHGVQVCVPIIRRQAQALDG